MRHCSGLCYGLFTTVDPDSNSEDKNAPTYSVAPKAESDYDRRRVLLGHIVATKTTNEVIKDEDMALPPNWEAESTTPSDLGHKDAGRTLCIHSLAVLPDYQGKGVGTNLIKGYIQRMKDSRICDRIALLAEDKLVPFYESLGFENVGPSEATFGGMPWNDMVRFQELSYPPFFLLTSAQLSSFLVF
jgi:GNAT superfamily N-acetyltransferase